MKKVAIIIPTYNQELLLEQCLKSLEKTNYQDYRVFLVDDASKTNIGVKIKAKFPEITLIVNKTNLGFGESNNEGIKKALEDYDPEYFLLLNDDTEIIEEDWLKKMVEIGESNKDIGILGCKILYENGDVQNIGGYVRKWKIQRELDNKKGIFEVDHIMGAFMLIKKEVFSKIGFLDKIFSPYLLEDTDFCLRAKKNGFKIVSVAGVSIIHEKGKTINSIISNKSKFIRYKNDIIFSLRHLEPIWAIFRIFFYLPLTSILSKTSDADELKIKNFKFRKDFIINLFILFIAFVYDLGYISKIKTNKN